MKFLSGIPMGEILADQVDLAANLPGEFGFVPTRRTDPRKVNGLLRKLHPIKCDAELIRFGPAGDGGYLIPNALEGIHACFSPGVSTVAGFERECADRGMNVYMADYSVENPPEEHDRFHFLRKFLGAVTNDIFISMDDWVDQTMPRTDTELLLQMDIEGAEYECILAMSMELQKRFRIMVFEFHYLDYLFSEPIFQLYSRAFEKLLLTHSCVHIHPNNVVGSINICGIEVPQLVEITFLRTDYVSNPVFAATFPHPLDCDNTGKAPLTLPASCYRGEGGKVELSAQ